MQHRITHSLDTETARKVARKAAESYTERFGKYSPTVRWETDDRAKVGFSAKGVTIDGTLQLEPGAIVVEVKVPLLLKPFAGKAVDVIEKQVQHWVQKAERGELDD
ncbi:MAG: polyhydroxyalkanoic acid system family protein [Myxococcales bacterium]|jgi:hypothetical protein